MVIFPGSVFCPLSFIQFLVRFERITKTWNTCAFHGILKNTAQGTVYLLILFICYTNGCLISCQLASTPTVSLQFTLSRLETQNTSRGMICLLFYATRVNARSRSVQDAQNQLRSGNTGNTFHQPVSQHCCIAS